MFNRHMVQLHTWGLRSKRWQRNKSIGLLISAISPEMPQQHGASQTDRRMAMATTTAMMAMTMTT